MKSNGLSRHLAAFAVLICQFGISQVAMAEETSLPVVDRKLYPMRLNPEFSVMGSTALATKYTSHSGLDFSATWHLLDNLALELHGEYFLGSESSITKILREKSRTTRQRAPYSASNPREPAVPGLQMLTYHVGADVQFAPIYGKLSFVGELEGSFQLYGLGGVGLAGTRTKTDKTLPPICNGPVTGGPLGGCADMYVGPQKLFTLPGSAFGDQDLNGPGEYQLLPLAVPVEYGLGLRIMLGKWVALRAELRNMHWLGVNTSNNQVSVNVQEPNDVCSQGYSFQDTWADSLSRRVLGGTTPCYLNIHTVTMARAGVSFIIPANSFF